LHAEQSAPARTRLVEVGNAHGHVVDFLDFQDETQTFANVVAVGGAMSRLTFRPRGEI
jgi:hypothetical protein